ncbi:unnamed protein product [Clavelina lepadiformis]|uniref:Uncharacterized protein n=1 Tax=Clavelina lepadiformis TaxID=159417 RepID=A0ABP0FK15_CLALP
MKSFVEVGILLALFVARGSSIQCYQCQYLSTLGDTSCYGPNIDSSSLQTCSTGQDHCLTTVARATVLSIEAVTISRSCSLITAETSCPVNTSVAQTCNYYCSEDGCNTGNGNGGSLVQASLVTHLLAMFGALTLIKW